MRILIIWENSLLQILQHTGSSAPTFYLAAPNDTFLWTLAFSISRKTLYDMTFEGFYLFDWILELWVKLNTLTQLLLSIIHISRKFSKVENPYFVHQFKQEPTQIFSSTYLADQKLTSLNEHTKECSPQELFITGNFVTIILFCIIIKLRGHSINSWFSIF